MSFEIVFMPAMLIMGAELRTTWMNNECYAAIPAFWQQQREQKIFEKIPNKAQPVLMALYTNYTPDFSLTSGYYSLIIGAPVTSKANIPEGMVVKELPASKYAVFTAKGPFAESIGKTWVNEIWQTKLDRTYTGDFEWYDANSTDDAKSIVKIYIAIK
ncbi:MAG TPA: GyrI-like domain-containing protein [Candidatus Babeliales bacterium]|nr:GyrI-like domain-containing protein [Candidatus Babeliales bacterium]